MGAAENKNISPVQKELLKWHWKLRIGMHRIQEMMCERHYEDPNGRTTILTTIIQPKNLSAGTIFLWGGGGGVWAKKVVTLRGLQISEKKEILHKPTVF